MASALCNFNKYALAKPISTTKREKKAILKTTFILISTNKKFLLKIKYFLAYY